MNILIDGIDGAGKSTLIDGLLDLIIDRDEKYYGRDDQAYQVLPFPTNLPQLPDKVSPLHRTLFHLKDFSDTLRKPSQGVRLYDRSFITTLAYQGFSSALLQDSSLYAPIFDLGSKAFFNDWGQRTQKEKTAVIVHVRCDIETASFRVSDRITDRVGEVEDMEAGERIKHLTELDARYRLIYPDLQMRLPIMYRDWRFHFVEVDTTEQEQGEVVVMEALQDIFWPAQPELF